MGRHSLIFEAIEFAAQAHRGQTRKGSSTPYILHPLAAARILLEAGCEEQVAIAAILHDVVEDTAHSLEEIEERFGGRVAELVGFATEPSKLWGWDARKRHTVERVRSAVDEEALLVSLADKLDNIGSIAADLGRSGEAAWSQFKRGRDDQRWYYTSLRDAFVSKLQTEPGRSLAARFDRQVRAVFGC